MSMSGAIRKVNYVLLNQAVVRRIVRGKETAVVYIYFNSKI